MHGVFIMTNNLDSYKKEITEDIKKCLQELEVPPILFFGSGMSQRYIGLPNWKELLEHLISAKRHPNPLVYYEQTKMPYPNIGSTLADFYHKDAWRHQENYSPELFKASSEKSIYIKTYISKYLEEKSTDIYEDFEKSPYAKEIKALQNIKPYAMITTNYDCLIEKIFPSYTPVVGYDTLKVNFNSIGEIYKIHGSITSPDSLVFTAEDYDTFDRKGKYISAKLLTFFAEHPLFIIGYSAQDKNIISILNDIDEIIAPPGRMAKNIYIVEYTPDFNENTSFSTEKIMSLNGREFRIKRIVANDFKWIFDILGSRSPIENVDIKLLRSISSRFYKMIQSDIPSKNIEVNFKTLREADSEEGLATLFGITGMGNSQKVMEDFPYSPSCISKNLFGKRNFYKRVNDIINKIEKDKGVDIKASNNAYHVAITDTETGKIKSHLYSPEALSIFEKVMKDQDYDLSL